MKLLAALLLILPVAAQSRFLQFSRDLTTAASELHIPDLRAEVSESGRVVWKRGALHAPVRTVPVESQEFAGRRIEWWFQSNCVTIQLAAAGLLVCADSKSLTQAPRLEDGNILRSSVALAFIKDVAGLPVSDREAWLARAFTSLYQGDRAASAALAHQALDKFPTLETTPDVTLLYLFSSLGLPETEASATAVIRDHPELPTAWFYYGMYLEHNKRYREAAACFNMIVDHQPRWDSWTVAAAKKELAGLQ